MNDEAKKAAQAEQAKIWALIRERAERCGGDAQTAAETLVRGGALKRDPEGRLRIVGA